jgi:hypothetical protein
MNKFFDRFVPAPHPTVLGWFGRLASKTAHLSGKLAKLFAGSTDCGDMSQ